MNEEKIQDKLKQLKVEIENELDSVMAFWLKHSHDTSHGGFYNCLDEDGSVYDKTKYGWLQGRQVWMYCKLYNNTQKYHTVEILDAARKGGHFLQTYFKRLEDNKCYFMTTMEGKPIKIQRTIFAECFYIMAMAGLYQATKDEKYQREALSVLNSVLHWIHVDDSDLGRPKLSGQVPVNSMSVPMMVICVLNEVRQDDKEVTMEYEDEMKWAVSEVLKHEQRNGSVILENIDANGQEISGSQGRLINPGHAIEAGWFLLSHALATNDENLKHTAIEKFIELPFSIGWDSKNSGLYYFLDADGFSPTQLEWNMKLWWPHCEAMIAFLMAYRETRNVKHFESFCKVFDYIWAHFKDSKHGEWYGYLDEKGEKTHRFKGGPFKADFPSYFSCSQVVCSLPKNRREFSTRCIRSIATKAGCPTLKKEDFTVRSCGGIYFEDSVTVVFMYLVRYLCAAKLLMKSLRRNDGYRRKEPLRYPGVFDVEFVTIGRLFGNFRPVWKIARPARVKLHILHIITTYHLKQG